MASDSPDATASGHSRNSSRDRKRSSSSKPFGILTEREMDEKRDLFVSSLTQIILTT